MILSWFKREKREISVPGGQIVYAIGDVHGRDDLLTELLEVIEADLEKTGAGKTVSIIFLGDYVDRGIGSKSVLDTLILLAQSVAEDGVKVEVIFLKGNHEEALLHFLDEPEFGEQWLIHGGTETLASYGVFLPRARKDHHIWQKVSDDFRAALGEKHLSFLNTLKLSATIGDYIFVHAGLRPGKSIEAQDEHDLLWIRTDFMEDNSRFEKKIVHGHTPKPKPYLDHRRIGVDTGAYITGVLTAVRLEENQVFFLQTGSKTS